MALQWNECLVAANSGLMVLVDSTYTHRGANQAYCDAHQRTRDEILGHTVAEAFGEEAFETTQPHFERCLAGEQVTFEYWWNSPRRGRRHVDALYLPVVETDGSVAGVSVDVRDTTDQWLTRQKLDQVAVSLHVTTQEMEKLSDVLAHGLKTPLLTVTNFCHHLRESLGDSLDEDQADQLQRIWAAGRHMTHVVQDLGDLADVNRRELRREEVNLSRLARGIMNDLSAHVPDRNVRFEAQPGITAFGDKALLKILSTNLLQNAWKYTAHSAHPRVELGVVEEESGLRTYHVRDNGIGFDNSKHEVIFRASERLHTTAEFTGTGIGLSTVDRIVSRHGGQVWAEARRGEGATFRFTLESPFHGDRRVGGPRLEPLARWTVPARD